MGVLGAGGAGDEVMKDLSPKESLKLFACCIHCKYKDKCNIQCIEIDACKEELFKESDCVFNCGIYKFDEGK